jgi:hypothetical protein
MKKKSALIGASFIFMLLIVIGILLTYSCSRKSNNSDIDIAVEKANEELWKRFINPEWHTIYNHADLDGNVVLPDPEECQMSKPNALSWDISISDGAMFGGFYIEAAIQRWMITGRDEDREKVRRIASGLLKLASVGQTEGFVARNVTYDGKSHYPLSSNDQTLPWCYGMWRYLNSGIPDETESRLVKDKIMAVAELLNSHGFKIPADRPPFDYFGDFSPVNWTGTPRMLFVIKMAYDVSGEERWEQIYRQALTETNSNGINRLEICRSGMVSALDRYHTWTAILGVLGLRGLWELEEDPAIKAAYEQGLIASAAVGAESLPLAFKFDNDDKKEFLLDWRALNTLWKEQKSVRDALDIGRKQLHLLDSLSPRRVYEVQLMREPLFGAWTIALCPDKNVLQQHAPAIMDVIHHFQFDKLYLSQFYTAELAYYPLKLEGIIE